MLKRRDLYREECLWLGLALALLWLILAVEWRGGADRRELWFWVASLLVVTGPMLVVSPVNARLGTSHLPLCPMRTGRRVELFSPICIFSICHNRKD